jgi:hypothetical protein
MVGLPDCVIADFLVITVAYGSGIGPQLDARITGLCS